VRRLETGSNLKLYLLDISKEELAADLSMAPDLRDAGIYRLLVEKSVEADPWTIILGNYSFAPEDDDLKSLARMAQVARRADAAFLAEASPQLLGFDSSESTPQSEKTLKACGDWTALRHLPEAHSVGLALPRFLLRLPYGKEPSPVESFDFEEFPEQPLHEDYLWGNPAFSAALPLAPTFSESGWDMRPGTVSDVDGLPLHIFQRDGDSEAKPCAEILMTEDEVGQIMSAGIMPLVSFKGSDKVRLARFQSIADPPSALSARWTS
jgi:type VI secretion system protein ImpC